MLCCTLELDYYFMFCCRNHWGYTEGRGWSVCSGYVFCLHWPGSGVMLTRRGSSSLLHLPIFRLDSPMFIFYLCVFCDFWCTWCACILRELTMSDSANPLRRSTWFFCIHKLRVQNISTHFHFHSMKKNLLKFVCNGGICSPNCNAHIWRHVIRLIIF